MPTCPYCLEEIKAGARKCPHCQTSLEANQQSDGNVVYILDRGFIRFGKFIAAAFGAFLIVGAYIYGLEFKDAIEKTSQAKFEVRQGLAEIENQRAQLDSKINDALNHIKEAGGGYFTS